MAQTINKTPEINIYVHRGAMAPVFFSDEDEAGTPRAFDGTLTCKITPDDSSVAAFTLTVGAGLTLSTYNSVANGGVMLKLTEAQSRLVAAGNFTGFEIQEGTTPNESIVLMGRMIGIGGANSGN